MLTCLLHAAPELDQSCTLDLVHKADLQAWSSLQTGPILLICPAGPHEFESPLQGQTYIWDK